MIKKIIISACVLTVAINLNAGQVENTNVDSVISYQAGILNNGSHVNYSNTETVKTVHRTTGSFMGSDYMVCPSNPPWSTSSYLALGSGSSVVMQLTNWIDVDNHSVTRELGIYAAGSMTGGAQAAIVSVSSNGSDWYSLNSGSIVDLDIPALAYEVPVSQTGAAGPYVYGAITSAVLDTLTETVYNRQTMGSYDTYSDSAFDSLVTYADITNSAGGNWFDLSDALDGSGIDQVGYVKIEVPGSQAADLRLDGVFINENSLGSANVPEPLSIIMLSAGAGLLVRRRRR